MLRPSWEGKLDRKQIFICRLVMELPREIFGAKEGLSACPKLKGDSAQEQIVHGVDPELPSSGPGIVTTSFSWELWPGYLLNKI